jgi:E3 ubiquitin-protein ligase RNF14
MTNCRISHASSVVSDYLAASPEAREAMERKYGAKTIKRLVDQYEEEKANSEWKEANTTACPQCEIYVEKSAGCNHMSEQSVHRLSGP